MASAGCWRATPIFWARMHALGVLVLALATAGCDAAMTPLHEAVLGGNAEAVKSLIARKVDLDARFDEPSHGIEGNYSRMVGITPLMLATMSGRLDIAK